MRTPAGPKRKTPAAFQTTGEFLIYRKSDKRSTTERVFTSGGAARRRPAARWILWPGSEKLPFRTLKGRQMGDWTAAAFRRARGVFTGAVLARWSSAFLQRLEQRRREMYRPRADDEMRSFVMRQAEKYREKKERVGQCCARTRADHRVLPAYIEHRTSRRNIRRSSPPAVRSPRQRKPHRTPRPGRVLASGAFGTASLR